MHYNLNRQINDNPAATAALGVIRQLQETGHEGWLVGGGVRDMLLDRNPVDFDVATSATPDTLARLFPHSNMVGAKFGVFIVRSGEYAVEVATFREEGEYHDRRRPDLIQFSTLENDARRRDFTVNALYYNPLTNELRDFAGGLDDIGNATLRTVGTAADRFEEDTLRILRALRFAANLDFKIQTETWSALCALASHTAQISVERVRDELFKGFTGGNADRFLDLLFDSGVLQVFLPEVANLKGCEQPAEFHPEGDVFNHTRLLLKNLPKNASPELAMAALLHDIAKPATQTFEDRIRFNGHDKLGATMAEEIGLRLRFSNNQISSVSDMIRRHMQFINVPDMKQSTLKRFLAAPTIDDELELHRLDCIASHGNITTYDFALKQLSEARKNEQSSAALPKPLVNGKDLIEAGLQPGPHFAPILRELFDAQLEGQFSSREDALEALMLITSRHIDNETAQ